MSDPFSSNLTLFVTCRAAMKMANMDAAFDFMFTNPRDEHGVSILGGAEFDDSYCSAV